MNCTLCNTLARNAYIGKGLNGSTRKKSLVMGSGGSYIPPFLRGKDGRMNGQIIRQIAMMEPSTIFSIAKELGEQSENKVHYSTVNRRIHDLEERGYVREVGMKQVKSGNYSLSYFTTIKGDFAALALDLTPSEQLKLLDNAGVKRGSPFMLMKGLIAKGLPLEFVQKELLDEATKGVMSGAINLELLDKEVICGAFSTLIARRLRLVLGEERGREYVSTVIEVLESLILNPFATELLVVKGQAKGSPRLGEISKDTKLLGRSSQQTTSDRNAVEQGLNYIDSMNAGGAPIREAEDKKLDDRKIPRQAQIYYSSHYSEMWVRELYSSLKKIIAN